MHILAINHHVAGNHRVAGNHHVAGTPPRYLVWLHHHAAVVGHHLAGGGNVHRPDARPQTVHAVLPVVLCGCRIMCIVNEFR